MRIKGNRLIREQKGNFMQKLLVELKNTPGNVQLLLVSCSVSSSLNREETLRVKDKVLANNNPEGVHSQDAGRPLKPFMHALLINMVEKVFNFGNLIWRTAIPPLSKGRGLLTDAR